MIKTITYEGLEFELESDSFQLKGHYYMSYKEVKYFTKFQLWWGISFGPKIRKDYIVKLPSYNKTVWINPSHTYEGIITNYYEVVAADKRSKKIESVLD